MRTHLTTRDIPCKDPACKICCPQPVPAEDLESVLESHTGSGKEQRHPVRDFLRLHFPAYCASHQVPEYKLKTMHALMACKTGDLGYTVTRCTGCGHTQMHACACGNRNCPSCGYLKELQWVEERKSEVIPGIPYFHLVFTLPHELNEILYQNQKETLDLLFRSVKDTILALARDKQKMVPGIVMILHTFGSDLGLHYHLHVLASGGGLSLDKKTFKRCTASQFFLPLRAVTRVYRGKFLDGLKTLRKKQKLQYFGDAMRYRNHYTWKDLLNTCFSKDWNVEIKYLAPVSSSPEQQEEETADNVAGYFGHYTNRTAISDSRIQGYGDGSIRFKYKKYQGSSYQKKEMSLSSEEFIRRFLMHLLPPGFRKIRYAGFLAGCVRQKNLALIHKLLGIQYHPCEVRHMSAMELICHFYGNDVLSCPSCHGELDVYPRMNKTIAEHDIRAA